jgi:hypothetical protein
LIFFQLELASGGGGESNVAALRRPAVANTCTGKPGWGSITVTARHLEEQGQRRSRRLTAIQGEEAAVRAPVAAQKLERVAPVSYRQGGGGVALEVLARAAASGTAETAVHRRQRRFYFFTIFTLLFNSMNCLRYNILNLVLIKKIFKYTLVFLEFSKKKSN